MSVLPRDTRLMFIILIDQSIYILILFEKDDLKLLVIYVLLAFTMI